MRLPGLLDIDGSNLVNVSQNAAFDFEADWGPPSLDRDEDQGNSTRER
jgi:hypothetical protein